MMARSQPRSSDQLWEKQYKFSQKQHMLRHIMPCRHKPLTRSPSACAVPQCKPHLGSSMGMGIHT